MLPDEYWMRLCYSFCFPGEREKIMVECGFALLASPFCQVDLNRFPGDARREGARKVACVCSGIWVLTSVYCQRA